MAPRLRQVGRAGTRPTRSRAVSWNLNQEGMGRGDLFHDGRVANRWPGCALKPGQYIEAVLLDRIDSELAGSVNARVTAAVSDVDGYGRELVPAGSIVVGRYKQAGGDDRYGGGIVDPAEGVRLLRRSGGRESPGGRRGVHRSEQDHDGRGERERGDEQLATGHLTASRDVAMRANKAAAFLRVEASSAASPSGSS